MKAIDLTKEFCIRGKDCHGFGHYGASRGRRKHKGIDVVANVGDKVLACSHGVISKIGYPYPPQDPNKGFLRYVEVTTDKGHKERYFYCDTHLSVGDAVHEGQHLATCQDLCCVYGGITPHLHFEVKKTGFFIDPIKYIEKL